MTVGFLIPCYNHEAYVGELLDSVLSQTRPADEVVVVDDGSTDGSVAVVQEFGKHVQLHARTSHGIGATYNHLLEVSTADVVAFVESDDVLEPTYLETCLEFMDEHEIPWVSTARLIIDTDGQPTGKTSGKRSPGPFFTTASFLAADIGRASTPVACRKQLVQVGPFATEYRIGMDTEMSLRFSTSTGLRTASFTGTAGRVLPSNESSMPDTTCPSTRRCLFRRVGEVFWEEYLVIGF